MCKVTARFGQHGGSAATGKASRPRRGSHAGTHGTTG
jgi:hypothetical protein